MNTRSPAADQATEPALQEGWVDSFQRYVALFGGMIATSLLMSLAAGWMISLRGVSGPAISVVIEPISAVLVLAACLLASLGVAIVVGRLVNPAVATFVLGWGLAALAMRSGTHLDLLFAGATGPVVAVETFIWGAAILGLAAVIFRFTGPLPDQPSASPAAVIDPRVIFGSVSLRSALAGGLTLVAIFFVATNDTKGQAIFAATLGGVLAGLAGRMLAPRLQPVLIFATPCVFIALAQLWAFSGDEAQQVSNWVVGRGSAFGIPTPLDAAAGALMGVSAGIGWSRGFVEQHRAD